MKLRLRCSDFGKKGTNLLPVANFPAGPRLIHFLHTHDPIVPRSRSPPPRPLRLPQGQHRHRLRAPLRVGQARAARARQRADARQRDLRHGRRHAPARQRRAPEDRHADGELRQRRRVRVVRARAPFDSRQIVHNLNRIWSPASGSTAPRTAPSCAARASCVRWWRRPTTSSTSIRPASPWCRSGCTRQFERNAEVALAIGRPSVHLVMPDGLGSGTPLIQLRPPRRAGRQGRGDGGRVRSALHALRVRAGDGRDVRLSWRTSASSTRTRPRRRPTAAPLSSCSQTHVIKSEDFAFVRPVIGFETFAEGRADRNQRRGRDPRAVRRLHDLHAGAARRSSGARRCI